MTKIVVTGASGVLGTQLVPLLRQSADVFTPDCQTLDLSRPIDGASLPQSIDAVVYLAQARRFRQFPDTASDIFQVNVANAVALADQARQAGASHFIYASTGGVYAPSDAALTEEAPLADAMTFYLASKLAAEHLLMPFAAHMTIIILRFFFIYGPGQGRDMLVPRLIDSVRDGRAIALSGEDGLRLNPIHACDAARATAAALGISRSMVINVAGPQVMSLRAMSEVISAKVMRAPQFTVDATAPPCHLVADTGRMDTLLGCAERRFGEIIAELL